MERMDDGLNIGDIVIPAADIEMHAMRAQGAGGQNVNKVSSAIHLRFDAAGSEALPDDVRERLLATADSRIGRDGVITIKAQRFRTQERNRRDALARLAELVEAATVIPKTRKATKPSRAAVKARLGDKKRRSETKQTRRKPTVD